MRPTVLRTRQKSLWISTPFRWLRANKHIRKGLSITVSNLKHHLKTVRATYKRVCACLRLLFFLSPALSLIPQLESIFPLRHRPRNQLVFAAVVGRSASRTRINRLLIELEEEGTRMSWHARQFEAKEINNRAGDRREIEFNRRAPACRASWRPFCATCSSHLASYTRIYAHAILISLRLYYISTSFSSSCPE